MAYANPEDQRAYERAWRERNREKIRAQGRARYAKAKAAGTLPEDKRIKRSSVWRAANLERARARERAYVRRKRAEQPEIYMPSFRKMDSDYVPVLLRDPCSYCGGAAGEIDHITPVIAGGNGDWTNLTATCRSCNARKNSRTLLTFLLDDLDPKAAALAA